MEQRPLPPHRSTILAVLPEKGAVRTCPSGCVHLTYGPVTLDFRCPRAFEELARKVAGHERRAGDVHLRYYHASLRFSREEFDELAGMVAEASRQLEQLEVVRRLLSGPCSPGSPDRKNL